MPYIKISDPNVIDLAAWQQVINVVNQHSDSITALTNNFGLQGTGETQWNGASDIVHQYDPATQQLLYGKTRINTSSTQFPINSSTPGSTKHMFYGDIEFADEVPGTVSFDGTPIVIASASFGDQDDNPPDLTSANVVLTVIAVTKDKFTFRAVNARSTTTNPVPLTGYFYISWMALGPK